MTMTPLNLQSSRSRPRPAIYATVQCPRCRSVQASHVLRCQLCGHWLSPGAEPRPPASSTSPLRLALTLGL